MSLPFDISALKTPCYIVDEGLLVNNLEKLRSVMERAGCRILLAQKAFSMFSLYPLIGRYLSGTAASGLFEARLGNEHMGGETHVFSAAYTPEEVEALLPICDHMVFNSMAQYERFAPAALSAGRQVGIRVNPMHSTQTHGIYDPCAPGSRLGVPPQQFPERLPRGVSGLHFHTLCEQNADALVETLAAVEERFGRHFPELAWINFGGGHHITRADYDVEALVGAIAAFRDKYGLQVYLEPGEAVALNTGYLVCSVLDVVENGMEIAILDASAACHMPDVLEMPYRPPLLDAGEPGERPHTYRLTGPTCLAGDVIGDFSFEAPLKPGDRLVFGDMAHYTMVKNNTFNGMPLPAIAVARRDGRVEKIKSFGYDDFKNRLS